MRTIFVLSTLTGALIAGLNGSDVSFAFSFAGMLAVAGLIRIIWRENRSALREICRVVS